MFEGQDNSGMTQIMPGELGESLDADTIISKLESGYSKLRRQADADGKNKLILPLRFSKYKAILEK